MEALCGSEKHCFIILSGVLFFFIYLFSIFSTKWSNSLHKSHLSPQLCGGEAVDTTGMADDTVSFVFTPEGIVCCSSLDYVQKAEVAPVGPKRRLNQVLVAQT